MQAITMFKQILHHNTSQDWFFALLALVVCVLALHLLRSIVLRRLTRVLRTDRVVVQFVVEVLSATRILLASAIGLYVALQFLNLPERAEKFSHHVFVALLVLQCGLWASRGMDFWLRHRFAPSASDEDGARATTRSLLSFLGRVVLWSLVALLMLDNLGFNVTTLVASLGIGGLAVALAVQNILGDLFASLSIAIDKPFVINDLITVDEFTGTVEHIGLKTTRLRSVSGEQIIVSNNDLLKSRIRNYKRMQERRAVLAIGVAYDTAHAQLEAIPGLLRTAIESQSPLRFERAHFKGFGPSSLNFEAVYDVLDPDYKLYMDIQQAVNLHVVRVFAERGISFAFPAKTLQVSGALSLTPAASAASQVSPPASAA
jgi:small-conductance mechanosensitive channel